ncbi:MAG TPA: hypothetical protein VFR81_05115 [Longimicrobium sp.]|nr:hypothetical protein [Longimicrobium sp.]
MRRLLRHEAGGARDAASLAAAAEGACRKLSGELEALVGRGGAAALLGRAVSLAGRELPFLAGVRPRTDAPLSFDAFRESLQGLGPAETEAAGVALLGNLVGLLINLLGEDLGLRPVLNVWPDVLPGAEPPASTEIEE